MNLTNYYWYFQSAIPHRICDDIVRYGKQLQAGLATTGGYGDVKKLNQSQIKDLKKKRDSKIVWMNDRWIYKEIQPYINQAIKMLVGIFNGIGQNLVNLLNIIKVNIMIGIVMVGINLIMHPIPLLMVKLENYL